MMKILSKCALVAAVASLALAGSMATADAAKKKGKAKADKCAAWTYKTATCTGAVCSMNRCGWEGNKWYPSLVLCVQPFCPK
jgi:hypothetical protein